jgi:hypothetical protein
MSKGNGGAIDLEILLDPLRIGCCSLPHQETSAMGIVCMVEKDQVLACYRFLLDRSPENDEVVEIKCMAPSLDHVVRSIVTGAEFLDNHKIAIAKHLIANRRDK